MKQNAKSADYLMASTKKLRLGRFPPSGFVRQDKRNCRSTFRKSTKTRQRQNPDDNDSAPRPILVLFQKYTRNILADKAFGLIR
jgi:hypothetical protein